MLLVVGNAPPEKAAAAPKPNFVFILTDDMRYDDLRYMPKTKLLLGNRGMTFTRAFVSNPLCCPARATIMRGQYAHNTGVWKNGNVTGPDAGVGAYRRNGLERDNVATRLNSAGYETALIGRYLSGPVQDETYVPPGWDEWWQTKGDFYSYTVNNNGRRESYREADNLYHTDALASRTERFIGRAASKPFFAYVAPKAPHLPATPARRHEHARDGLKAPRGPSYDEAKVGDKPPWIKYLDRIRNSERAKINKRHEMRVESLLAVDAMVQAIVEKLRQTGQLSNTYIFFTSDNGWHHGEHRVKKSKARPYEESIRVPLVVRGPGIAPGSKTGKLALNTDYLPTFTDLAGIRTPNYVDGRSLAPVLRGRATSWRKAALIESKDVPEGGRTPAFAGVRTTNGQKYVVYEGGHKELYNLRNDSYELFSKDRSVPHLASRLKALKNCERDRCRRAENGG